jgi:regulatory protein
MTEHELRMALGKKASRAARVHGPCSDVAGWIDALVEQLKHSLLLDDGKVASARVASDVARGRSRRMVAQRLRQKGIATEVVQEATAAVDDDASARAFVGRRRLQQKDRQKALAALARQGFSFDVARRALEGEA